MRWLSICVVLADLAAAPNAVLANGGHSLSTDSTYLLLARFLNTMVS
jgi:hypothetical protein